MAEGGATYTVNIELATRQFSQDLRDLRTKIKNELGKTIKVAATPDQKAEAKEKARKLREQRQEDKAAKKRFYNADRIKAFQVRQGKAVSANLALEKLGYDVQVRKTKLGEVQKAAEKGKVQWAEAKLKQLNQEIDKEFKILDLINKQAAAEKKAALQAEERAKKEAARLRKGPKGAVMHGPFDLYGNPIYQGGTTSKSSTASRAAENRQRRGPGGIRMHGPVDMYGNPIYPGKGPSIPKSGAALPIDLGRKGTGTFSTQQTKLLRRREVLETLLKTFDGIQNPQVKTFKRGIETLLTEYTKLSTLQNKQRPQGKQYVATGGWGEWKDGKLVTKDHIGNAGEIARQIEVLDDLTRKEESRAKRIKAANEAELKAAKRRSAFLNKEHSSRKLIQRLKNKEVKTTELELKLEKAITAQDKEQLDAVAREIDMTNARTTRAGKVGKKGGSGGGTTSAKTGGGGKWGRIASAAGISGGFPLLFGQSPGVAAISALGGGIGEAFTPGGGFAGGIVASALATKIAEVVQFRTEVSNLNKDMAAMGISSEFSAGQIVKLGKALRVTKQEALEIAKGFKRYGGKTGGLFAEFFGDAQTFEATAGAIDIQSAIAAIKAQEKDMTVEQELRYRIMLQTQGVEETINALVEKRIKATREAFKEEQKNQRSRESARNLSYWGGMSYHRDSFTEQQQKDLDAQIEKEKELITQFEKQRDLRNELALAAERQAQSVATAMEAVEKELRKLNNAQYQVVQLANSISSAFSESFKGIVSGSMTAQEALRNLFQRTADHFLDMAAQMIAQQIKMKILGIGLNWVASSAGAQANVGTGRDGTFGLGTHGSGIPTGAEGWGFSNRAKGGPVTGGSPYIVGERGPELFVPDSAGTIIPNHEMGGANVVVNVDASGSSVEGDAGAAQELGSMLAAAIQAELVKEKRPGGLLA